ncbi:MAG: DMT family transporter [Gaiella sp.]
MTVVGLSLASAVLFGAMAVALRVAITRGRPTEAGALFTLLPALVVALVATALTSDWDLGSAWPYLIAGLLAPGISQITFTHAVRLAGSSRASVTVGTAPLFGGGMAIALLGEPVVAGLVVGAILIVSGGSLLVTEQGRPGHVRTLGIALALLTSAVFSGRDVFVRWLGTEVSDTDPALALTATLVTGIGVSLVYLRARRATVSLTTLPPFLLPGVLMGLSYVCLFEAFFRGRITVISPIVATEALFGVVFSALLLRHTERVGRKLVLGALLVVLGGVLIGLSR